MARRIKLACSSSFIKTAHHCISSSIAIANLAQFSSLPEINPTADKFPQSFLSPFSILSPHRSSHRSPLFLSYPSSLLSQLSTPFYCPRDINLRAICRNDCVNDVVQQHNRPRAVPQSAVGETGTQKIGFPNVAPFRQDVGTVGVREELTVQWRQDVFNWPNAISFGRLLSGPFLAWLILEGFSRTALCGLLFAGASDWLDGYIARKKGIDSVVGTYLDPLADKVLIGSVTLSMAQAGYLHPALVALVVARDAALVGGSVIYRAYYLNWKWSNWKDFFDIAGGTVQKVKPLFISKVNTMFQLALIGTALVQPAFGIEDTYSLIPLLSWSVVFTTCASWMSYGLKLLPKQSQEVKWPTERCG